MIARVVPMLCLAGTACETPARVTLAPINGCGPAIGANALQITAFHGGSDAVRDVPLDRAFDIADFPADTTQISAAVIIGGGLVGAAGKTAPFEFDALADGATLPIYMGTLGGFCPTAGMLVEARRHPLVAPAGDGALVVGGGLATAEYYDRATSTFSPVEVPGPLVDAMEGLEGMVLAPLPDGRVFMSGGTRGLFAVFDPDPAHRGFGATGALSAPRAFHGVAAIDAQHVLVAGGCHTVTGGTCDDLPLRSTFVVDLAGGEVAGPNLTPDAIVEGAQLFDTGAGFVLAGGVGTPGQGQRFALADAEAEKLVGLGGQATLLDGGGVLTGFGADGATGAKGVVVVGPGLAPATLRDGPTLAGAHLVTAEDGSVFALGGAPDARPGAIAHYVPTHDGWDVAAPIGDLMNQPVLEAPSIARLVDGSFLVIGGDAAPSQQAWIFRPSLVGPTTGRVTAQPKRDDSPVVLTVADPTTLTRPNMEWVLTARDDTLAARAIVGGPRFARGSVQATVTATGAFALIGQQTAPDRALVAHLEPGQPATIEQLGAGVVCASAGPVDFAGGLTATLHVGDGVTLVLHRADPDSVDETVISCNYRATAIGAWGIAATKKDSQIAVNTVTVARE